MSELRVSLNVRKIFALIFIWISIPVIIIGGYLVFDYYQSDVLEYLGYYIIILVLTVILYGILTRVIIRDQKIRRIAQIPIVLWIVLILFAGIAGIAYVAPQRMARNFSTAPYIMWDGVNPPSTSMVVSWITSSASETQLHWGLSASNLDQIAIGTPNTRYHHINFTDLTPNTTYYYQVPGFSIKEFRTAPVGTFNYTFMVWSDHRTNTQIMESAYLNHQWNIVDSMYSYIQQHDISPAFSMFTGDMTSHAGDYQSWQTWFQDITTHDWATNQSLQIAYGNHERKGDTPAQNVSAYFPYKQQSDGHFYYSFDYGIAHFIILDTYISGANWNENFSAEQKSWLESDLIAHQNATYKLIFMHPPPWEYAGVAKDLGDFSVQYGIDLILCGHHHKFDLRDLNGTKVLMEGLGGNPNNYYRDFEIDTAFTQIDVSSTELHVTLQFTNGTKLTDFTIAA
jgi:hypothetical protein